MTVVQLASFSLSLSYVFLFPHLALGEWGVGLLYMYSVYV